MSDVVIRSLVLSRKTDTSILRENGVTYNPTSETAIAIEAVNQELEAAMAAGSASRLTAIYTAKGQLLPPNTPIIQGHDNIHAYWEAVVDQGIGEAELETIELDELGETAIEIGLFVMKTTEGSIADTGKYLIVWKKEQGTWKYHRDIWSSSNAAL